MDDILTPDAPDNPLTQIVETEDVPDTTQLQGVQVAAAARSAQDEEDVGLEVGDRLLLLGGRYNRTRGFIYYLDSELIRILPDGVSDRLIDIPIYDDAPDPDIQLEEIKILKKRTAPSFVEFADIRVGQIAETFTASGDPHLTYKVTAVNPTDDTATLQDEMEAELVLYFRSEEGITRGIERDQRFAVIRTQEAPAPLPTPEAAAASEASALATELEAEALPVSDEAFEVEAAEMIEVQIFEGIQEKTSSRRLYPDHLQKADMLQDLLKGVDLAQQRNRRKILKMYRLVENMAQLRNDITQYKTSGVGTPLPTVFQTLSQLLEKTDFPLAKQVLSVARALYLDHTLQYYEDKEAGGEGSDPISVTDPNVLLQYLEDSIQQGIEYIESQLGLAVTGTVGAVGQARALPRWYAIWQGFINDYFKVLPPVLQDNLVATTSDKDVFRTTIPQLTEEATLTGLPKLDQDRRGVVTADSIGKVDLSYVRTLGARINRYAQKKVIGAVEQADEAQHVAYILFPLLFARDLGMTRSGQLALDMAHGLDHPKTMRMILQSTGGDITDIPAQDSIVSMSADGGTLGNIEVSDWLKLQTLYGEGLGNLYPYLRNFGLVAAELSVEQQDVLLKKIQSYRSAVKRTITTRREEIKESLEKPSELVNETLLPETSVKEIMDRLATEPLLNAALSDFTARYPSYSANDIARFAYLYLEYADLLLSTLAQSAEGVAIERRRAVRDQFLKALRDSMALSEKLASAGEAPQPNPCVHVESLEQIRKVELLDDRMKLMAKFLTRFRGDKEDHWIQCRVCDKHLLCEHEYLQIQEYLHPNDKEELHKQLVIYFSGGESSGSYICRNCGQPLKEIEYDTNLEYDDEGKPMQGRAVLVDEDALMDEQLDKVLTVENEEEMKVELADGDKRALAKILGELTRILGVFPGKEAVTRMVERAAAGIAKRSTREAYQRREAAKAAAAQREGKPYAATDYPVYADRIQLGYVSAVLLIEIQTAIPGYTIRYNLASCDNPSFAGEPLDPGANERDRRAGMTYMACALAANRNNEHPWMSLGTKPAARQGMAMSYLNEAMRDLVASADVQQELIAKRAYLEEHGAGASPELTRAKERIPDGFTPEQIFLPKAEAAAAAERTIAEAATPSMRARAWILEGHRIARKNGTYVVGSPFSEGACCYSLVASPNQFWRTQQIIPLPEPQPPRGPIGSILVVHMIPRPLQQILGKPDPTVMYRLFMQLCFRGERVGLPHEPGYDRTCPWCGLVFPQDPRMPPPQPMYAKDKSFQKKLDEEYVTLVERRAQEDQAALQEAGQTIDDTTFEELLDEAHRRYLIAPLEPVTIPAPSVVLQRLGNIRPAPFGGFPALMQQTLVAIGELAPGAERIEIAQAFAPLSEVTLQLEQQLEKRIKRSGVDELQKLYTLQPRDLSESLRTYFLLPFQRLLTQINLPKVMRIQPQYKFSSETKQDIENLLNLHVDFTTRHMTAVRDSPFVQAKLQEAADKLSVLLPYLSHHLRDNLLPGGSQGMEFLLKAIILGIFAELLNPNHVASETPVELPAREVSGQALKVIQIFMDCLIRFRDEGLNFTPEQIRLAIAKRNEMEKQRIIDKLDKMTKEAKMLELMKKRLGLGDWAVGGTKVIWQYDEDYYAREKRERAEAGIYDVPAYGPSAEMAGDEGGYDVQQQADDE